MGKEETQLDDERKKYVAKLSPMQINLHGWCAYMRHWYKSLEMTRTQQEIHDNCWELLGYLFETYVPEYDDGIHATDSHGDTLGEEE